MLSWRMETRCSSSAIREALNIPSWNCRANWFRIIPPIESRELRNPGGPPTALVPTEEIGRASCRERVVSTCRSRWSPYHSNKKHMQQSTQYNIDKSETKI